MEQRLIDANALKKEVGSTFHGLTVTGAVHEIIDRQPTIDPESLRSKGHWERPSKLLNIVNCTACKTTFPGDFDEFRYCPHCGAKLRSEDGGLTMKTIVDRIGKPALLEQTAEECTELAHACLKEARRLRGENPTPKTTPECWLAISEELTDVQICIEMLDVAGYHGDPALADVKRQRMAQRLDDAGK